MLNVKLSLRLQAVAWKIFAVQNTNGGAEVSKLHLRKEVAFNLNDKCLNSDDFQALPNINSLFINQTKLFTCRKKVAKFQVL